MLGIFAYCLILLTVVSFFVGAEFFLFSLLDTNYEHWLQLVLFIVITGFVITIFTSLVGNMIKKYTSFFKVLLQLIIEMAISFSVFLLVFHMFFDEKMTISNSTFIIVSVVSALVSVFLDYREHIENIEREKIITEYLKSKKKKKM